MTVSELIVTALIWLLTAIGGFFGLRAAWRRNLAGRMDLIRLLSMLRRIFSARPNSRHKSARSGHSPR